MKMRSHLVPGAVGCQNAGGGGTRVSATHADEDHADQGHADEDHADQGHADEDLLGPVDYTAWGAGALGVAIGLVMWLCFVLATSGSTVG